MTDELIGREDELSSLRAFLEPAPVGPVALVIDGEPGIGKTTLWLAGIAAARDACHHVLVSRPVEAETKLSFAALADLLEGVIDEILPGLPDPQRHALEVALLMRAAEREMPDERAVATAFLSALRGLCSTGRVVIAIDDVQWLDPASAAVIAFTVRRLGDEPTCLLLAQRREQPPSAPLGLDRTLPPTRLHRLEPGPLSLGALHRILHARLGRPFARPELRRIHSLSGGNPFFALEIGRAVQESEGLEPGQPLPVPAELHQLPAARLGRLPADTQSALLIASALSQPTVKLLERSFRGDVRSAMEPAIDAGVIEVDGSRLRFTHPLLASATYSAVDTKTRLELHRRLAAVVDDPEERARHLALASPDPDADVAMALEEAARRARARGATAAAAELAEHARRLTPSERTEDALRRSVLAAEHHFAAGDAQRARIVLQETVEAAPSGPVRADLLIRLARVHTFESDQREAARLFRQALVEAGIDPSIRAMAEWRLAVTLMRMLEDLPAALEHARSAVALAEQTGDALIRSGALGIQGLLGGLIGEPGAEGVLERAVRLAPPAGELPLLWHPRFDLAALLVYTDRLDQARAHLVALRRDAVAKGDEGSLPLVLRYLSYVEWLLGDWPQAVRYADEGLDAAAQTGQASQYAVLLACKALVDAHLGRSESARTLAEEALSLGRETGAEFATLVGLSALGFLELSLGDYAAADGSLGKLVGLTERAGIGEPGAKRFLADEIEALVAIGRLDDAETLLGIYAEQARRLDRPSALAASYRCRGLLLASCGRTTEAIQAFERALEEHERVSTPFERARTLLALGSTLRRAKKKRAARESIRASLAIFEELGARLWAEKARSELARIGGRAPASGELTPTEERVATLVAEGRATKEVAAELFMSVKTVEGHLSHIYAKLGVRSRAELARRFPHGRAQASPP